MKPSVGRIVWVRPEQSWMIEPAIVTRVYSDDGGVYISVMVLPNNSVPYHDHGMLQVEHINDMTARTWMWPVKET